MAKVTCCDFCGSVSNTDIDMTSMDFPFDYVGAAEGPGVDTAKCDCCVECAKLFVNFVSKTFVDENVLRRFLQRIATKR